MLEADQKRAGRNRWENGKQTPYTFGGLPASMPRTSWNPAKKSMAFGGNFLIISKPSRLEENRGMD